MSNLLNNNNKPKKKLLDRGPKIVPAQEFKLEEVTESNEVVEVAPTQEPQQPKKATKPAKKTKKRSKDTDITSVRVKKATRNKLNTLIQLGKGDSVDELLDVVLQEYLENSLLTEEKKTFDLLLEVIQKRDK